MNECKLRVSKSLLEGFLHLPDGVSLKRVSDCNHRDLVYVELIVEGADLPVLAGKSIPLIDIELEVEETTGSIVSSRTLLIKGDF